MFINKHFIGKYNDTHPCAGRVLGVEAASYPPGMANMDLTEVVYKNMTVWGPPGSTPLIGE
jgi:hypothetical protein